MIPLFLATLLACQDPAAPRADWRDMDGIVYVINEDRVTLLGLQKRLRQFMSENPSIDQKRARSMLRDDIVRNAVGSQAGEAMGIDPNLVKRSVRDYEKRMIDARGGVDQYSAFLTQSGQTADEVRSEIEKFVLRDMWEASRTGKGPNQQQKIIADRFVRPGTLRLTYQQFARDPRLVGRIDGSPSKVVLQVLEVDPVKVGGTANVEKAAAQIQARIASGASDFEKEVPDFALSTSKSAPTEPLDEARLMGTDPDLAQLVARAKEGEVLPALAPHGNTVYWRIVRLVRRTPAQVPALGAPGVQKKLRELLQDLLDARRLDLARKQQFESSYIWPPVDDSH